MTSTTNKSVLLVLIAVTAIITIPSAVHAQDLPPPCVGCEISDPRVAISESLLDDLQIVVQTDKEQYNHDDTISITGQVANPELGYAVTLTVTNPLYNVVTIDQLTITRDGSFATALSTVGQAWKYNGQYTIDVYYGTSQRDNSVNVEMTGQFNDGLEYKVVGMDAVQDANCGVKLDIDNQCVPFVINGGTVIDATLNIDDKSIVINIDSVNDGTLALYLDESIQDGIFLVLVDGEEWDDVEIVGRNITVMFPAGTEQIEIFGTFLIPEFGAVSIMVLMVAIVSIIALSSRSRLTTMQIR